MENAMITMKNINKGYDEKRERYLTTKDFVLKWKLLKHKYPDWCFELY